MAELYKDEDFSKSKAKLNVESVGTKFEKMFTTFFATYPMAEYTDLDATYSYRKDAWPDVINYIKLVDSTL